MNCPKCKDAGIVRADSAPLIDERFCECIEGQRLMRVVGEIVARFFATEKLGVSSFAARKREVNSQHRQTPRTAMLG